MASFFAVELERKGGFEDTTCSCYDGCGCYVIWHEFGGLDVFVTG